jgi:hypothetical protein
VAERPACTRSERPEHGEGSIVVLCKVSSRRRSYSSYLDKPLKDLRELRGGVEEASSRTGSGPEEDVTDWSLAARSVLLALHTHLRITRPFWPIRFLRQPVESRSIGQCVGCIALS